jgi:hypothetical protein
MISDFLNDLKYLIAVFLEATKEKTDAIVSFLTQPLIYTFLLGLSLGLIFDIIAAAQLSVLVYGVFLLKSILIELIEIRNNIIINSRNQVKSYAVFNRMLTALNNIPGKGKKNSDG